VFKAHRLVLSLNSRMESNKEEGFGRQGWTVMAPPEAGRVGGSVAIT